MFYSGQQCQLVTNYFSMKTVEYFAGTKSFSKVMAKNGHQTFTIDTEKDLQPDLICDILQIDPKGIQGTQLFWASPPCTGFSVAAIGHHWGGGFRKYEPKTETAKLGMRLVMQTIETIKQSKPDFWFIENPRGVLRKLEFMETSMKELGGVRHTVTYCQYGENRMKPTDIWTNADWWKPRPMCKNGAPCHEAAPRGSKTGTQGIKGARDRGVIPPALFEEILEQYNKIKI